MRRRSIALSAMLSLLLLLPMILPAPAAAEGLKVVYPQRPVQDDADAYPLAVLQLALDKSGRPYELSQAPRATPFPQSVQQLLEGGAIQVIWAPTNYLLETMFHPVRVPIYRGLGGYRLFLIQRARQPLFHGITSLDDLRPLLTAEGFEWPTREILETADLRVFAASYDTIVRLLSLGRIDFFPRGLPDIFIEQRRQSSRFPEIAVEEELLLRYDAVRFFFVNKSNIALQKALERGFAKAYEDGSFQELFNSHPDIREALDRAQLKRRRIIRIDNPYVTRETASLPEYLFHHTP